MINGTKGMAVVVALGATVALAACKKADTGASADTTAMAAGADTSMRAGSMSSTSANGSMAGAPASANASAMTDAEIFSMVSNANQGEIDAGRMAETKATNPAVKAFARDMVTEHGAMLAKGTALAKKLNITPKAAANDSTMAMNKTMASMLSSAPKGMAFDTAYVNGQVAGHQHVLDMVKNAEGQAQNADLKTMLTNAQPAIQRHLDRIKDIQGKMK